jgi:hypothetical protein
MLSDFKCSDKEFFFSGSIIDILEGTDTFEVLDLTEEEFSVTDLHSIEL